MSKKLCRNVFQQVIGTFWLTLCKGNQLLNKWLFDDVYINLGRKITKTWTSQRNNFIPNKIIATLYRMINDCLMYFLQPRFFCLILTMNWDLSHRFLKVRRYKQNIYYAIPRDAFNCFLEQVILIDLSSIVI